ncbi:sugar-transfer associated ATP-grasp domain-containing protein [Alkalicoccus daliensis]|uniref:Sugar-transfer associated ATP-grasp n=1 Tax=Alkalicoccus daliensis TaxID=745820 RepID=A0A1H0GHY9_9BACI|nr:sugar-transfer associated ATP-grasp domain-containing protein [Alkalicoccus daliensis]SDO06575.1 Sugar-transfer associated ATP-grasp [Alkalicoccus daliensis]
MKLHMNEKMLAEFKASGFEVNTKPFKRYYEAGLLQKLDAEYMDKVKKYWFSNYGLVPDTSLHAAFYNVTGLKEEMVVPGKVMWDVIIPYLNDLSLQAVYSDKNIYDKLITTKNAAEAVLKRVNGTYFDTFNNVLNYEEAILEIKKQNDDLIVKPSNTDNGKGISKLSVQDGKIFKEGIEISLEELELSYHQNFIIQKRIKQHPVLAEPHPSSVNTLRMVTLRWKNKIHYLLTFARFGSNNAVQDNAGAGGVCVGVSDSGELLNIAVDENGNTHNVHPTTGYDFSKEMKIPEFGKCIDFVKNLHKDVLHQNFVSWDIAINEMAEPVFIEANFRGATWLYQLASQRPMFGELTEELLKTIKEERDKEKLDLEKFTPKERKIQDKLEENRARLKKSKSSVRKLRRENEYLNEQVNELKTDLYRYEKELKELEMLKEQEEEIKNYYIQKTKELEESLTKMKYSSSWKITKPLRKAGQIKKKLK